MIVDGIPKGCLVMTSLEDVEGGQGGLGRLFQRTEAQRMSEIG